MSPQDRSHTEDGLPEEAEDPILALAPRNTRSGKGEGEDRRVDRRSGFWRNLALWGGAAVLLILVVGGLLAVTGDQRLSVERDELTIAEVRQQPFQEYAAITGNVVPHTSIYLDAVEGGRVEEVFVEEGETVAEGQPLLRLSNNDLQLRMLAADAQRIEQVNRLEDIRFRLERNALELRQQLAEMDYEIERLQRLTERRQRLFEEGILSEQELQDARDELEYFRNKRELTLKSYRQEEKRMESQLAQMEASLDSMYANAEVIGGILDNLVVRAPVAGRLTALDADVGELRSPGSRLGQIDVLKDGFKVRAEVDEYYIGRVTEGQAASSQPLFGDRYPLTVTRVYPQVEEGKFEIDLAFERRPPDGLRRGQTIRARLELSDATETLVLPRGPFYRETGGHWVYVVDNGEAHRRSVRLGRQNPEAFEVLEGLTRGDRVIVSSYEPLGESDVLELGGPAPE